MTEAGVVEERRKEFERLQAEICERQRSNSASFDKYILTLSSSGLAISVTAFLNDSANSCVVILFGSWICFFITISVALAAFFVSNKALDRQLEIAQRYYIDLKDESFETPNGWSVLNTYLNGAAGVLFLIALMFLVLYAATRVI